MDGSTRAGPTELRCIGSWSNYANPEQHSAGSVLRSSHNDSTSPHQGDSPIFVKNKDTQKAVSQKDNIPRLLDTAHGKYKQYDDPNEFQTSGMDVDGLVRSDGYSDISQDGKAALTGKQHSTAGLWQPRCQNLADVKLDPWHGSQLLVPKLPLGCHKEGTRVAAARRACK